MEPTLSQNNLCDEPTTIHVLELIKDDFDLLQQVTIERLKGNGIHVKSLKRRESRAKSRTPIPQSSRSVSNSLQDLVDVKVKSHNNVNLAVPKFLPIMCNFIANHVNEQGVFRLAGSSTRINSLLNALHNSNTQVIDPTASVFDVCSALKQLIRKMEEPLIPSCLHYIFLRALELPEDQRYHAILQSIFLLPKNHLHILFYLMEFLHEVAAHSGTNKMDAKNLSIVFAPNIMQLTSIPTKKSGKDSDDNACGEVINHHVEIVKILIEAGDRLGVISNDMAGDLVTALCKNSEDELEMDNDIRKRKRSTSLNRALTSAAGVLEFICKKKSRKGAPISTVPLGGYTTPGDMHTPIIRPLSRKRGNETAATPLSTSTKNRLIALMNKKKSADRFQTPVRSGGILQPSPLVSLNPRPVIREEVVSAKTGTLRNGRTMQRANATRNLPDTSAKDNAKTNTKLALDVVPLTKSPRRRSPRQNIITHVSPSKPPRSTPKYDLCEESLDASKTHFQVPDDTLRFTPMLQEIKGLTLAALQEQTPVEHLKTATDEVVLVVPNDSENAVPRTPKVVVTASHGGKLSRVNTTKSKLRVAEARRCQSLNDANRARTRRTGHVPRRKSDGTSGITMTLRPRFKPLSVTSLPASPSPVSAQVRKNAQSLITLNRSPTKCTLRRGRPNTTRTGLPRPSPVTTTKSQTFLPPESSTPINITIDRKGRVSKRIHTRPPLIIPHTTVDTKKAEAKQGMVKPPRLNAKNMTKVKSPKKPKLGTEAHAADCGQDSVSYVASKLKREVDGTVKLAVEEKPLVVMPTTPSSRKGRSFSMRSDMIRPSPNKINSHCNSLSRKLTNCYEVPESRDAVIEGVVANTVKPLKRGSSVQELVKKFDSNGVPQKPIFATVRREKVGRLPLPNSQARSIKTEPLPIPPAKPPRTTLLENRNTTKLNSSSKQTAQFNVVTTVTRSSSVRGPNQVLKTINLALSQRYDDDGS